MSPTTSSTHVPRVIATPVASPAVSTVSSAASIGLSPTKVYTDGASVEEIIAVLIFQRFTVIVAHIDSLKSEMVTYFAKVGVANEHNFSIMAELKSWSDVSKAGPRSYPFKHISVSVILLLTKVLFKKLEQRIYIFFLLLYSPLN